MYFQLWERGSFPHRNLTDIGRPIVVQDSAGNVYMYDSWITRLTCNGDSLDCWNLAVWAAWEPGP